ncbi:hypothetical protein [Streptomyces sp. DHE17-7]|uniref:hypothetical protein n=1 Tax=Streptomyces sp. DHE17-7 TaxID=2759949 RepID=UPI0022EB8AE9|nr:hypothetical protein [Streptomyces sp. DHE17-7]MBJ6623520.1 hypothetical protein [Streptomyces sp. DHE17-7]
MNSQTPPPPQGSEYTPCACSHIEPEHEPNAGECYSCDCAAYRPAAAAPLPPADQTTPLRDRIAEAALAAVESALGDTLVPAARAEALAGIAAVLPAPADQAAALREAADFFERTLEHSLDPDSDPRYCTAIRDVVMGLRRRADETATTETQAANETPPPGGYAHRVCRHCWTGIHWTNGQWAHPDEPRGHTPEPPSLPVEPAAGAQQDGAQR